MVYFLYFVNIVDSSATANAVISPWPNKPLVMYGVYELRGSAIVT